VGRKGANCYREASTLRLQLLDVTERQGVLWAAAARSAPDEAKGFVSGAKLGAFSSVMIDTGIVLEQIFECHLSLKDWKKWPSFIFSRILRRCRRRRKHRRVRELLARGCRLPRRRCRPEVESLNADGASFGESVFCNFRGGSASGSSKVACLTVVERNSWRVAEARRKGLIPN